MSIEKIANHFHHSFHHKEWTGDKEEVLKLSISEAYEVQDLVTKKRLAEGETLTGYKVGCTSTAIRKQFGINEPICGRLFSSGQRKEPVRWDQFIRCAIEPEMIIKFGKALEGYDLSDDELISSIEYVSVGIEIHEYNFWIKPPVIQELISTGGIHHSLIVGERKTDPFQLNFADECFEVYQNDKLVASNKASEIMGGPLKSIKWLVGHLTSRGMNLTEGSLVIPGSPVELIPIERDMTVTISIDKLGKMEQAFLTKNQ